MLRDGSLSAGHARALLPLEDDEKEVSLAQRIVEKELSVREVERMVAAIKRSEQEKETPEEAPLDQRTVYMKDLEERMMRTLGRRVKIRQGSRKRVVELSFEDDKDLEELLRSLAGQDIFG